MLQLFTIGISCSIAISISAQAGVPSLDLGFSPSLNASANLRETEGSFEVTVHRAEDGSALTLTYETTSTGTATPGKDFVPAAGKIVFSPDEMLKTFELRVLDDDAVEGHETIGLRLMNGAETVEGLLLLRDNDFEFVSNSPTGEKDLELSRIANWPGYAGGPMYSVKMSGSLALVGVVSGNSPYQLFDVSDKSNPKRISEISRPDFYFYTTYALSRSGRLACFMSYFGSKLEVYEFEPTKTLGFKGSAIISGEFVALSDSSAYVTGEGGLTIVDLSSSAQPRVLGRKNGDGRRLRAAVVDRDIAYVPIWGRLEGGRFSQGGLHLFDVSDSMNPRRLGTFESSLSAWSVAIAGTFAYLTEWDESLGGAANAGRLTVLDVSNPAMPIAVAFLKVSGRAIAVVGTVAYVSNGISELVIVDISNPRDPKVVRRSPGGITDISADSETLAVTDLASGFAILDITNPFDPVAVGKVKPIGSVRTVAISGSHAFVGADELTVVDLSDATFPKKVASYGSNLKPTGIVVRDTNAFLVGTTGFEIVDVSDPLSPKRAGGLPDLHGIALDIRDGIAVVGRPGPWLGTSGWLDGELITIDVSSPSNPRRLGSIALRGAIWRVIVSGNVAYVSGYAEGGVQVVDIANPAIPMKIGEVPGNALGMALAEDRLYLGEGILDVSTLMSPRFLSGGFSESPRGVGIHDATVFWANGSGAFVAVDVTRPTEPLPLGNLQVPSYAYSEGEMNTIEFKDDFAVYAAGMGGLEIIDPKPANPARLTSVSLGPPPRAFQSPFSRASSSGLLKGPGKTVMAFVNESVLSSTGEQGSGFLHLIDCMDPVMPKKLAQIDLAAPVTAMAFAEPIAIVGTLGATNLWIYDVSAPEKPRLLSQTAVPTSSISSVTEIVLADKRALVLLSNPEEGMLKYNITDPSRPVFEGTYPLATGWIQQFQGKDAVVFALDPEGNVFAVNPDKPGQTTPLHKNAIGLEGVRDFHVEMPFVYYADRLGLRIVDARVPNQARIIGSVELREATRLAVSGSLAYIATQDGLAAIDISKPSEPTRVGGNSALISSQMIVVGDNLVTLSEREMTIYNSFVPPAEPVHLAASLAQDRLTPELMLRSAPGTKVVIQRSIDLHSWSDWTNFITRGVTARLLDTSSRNAATRYYRAVAP